MHVSNCFWKYESIIPSDKIQDSFTVDSLLYSVQQHEENVTREETFKLRSFRNINT